MPGEVSKHLKKFLGRQKGENLELKIKEGVSKDAAGRETETGEEEKF